jgi:Leucine-rich repeat (LRR) protein
MVVILMTTPFIMTSCSSGKKPEVRIKLNTGQISAIPDSVFEKENLTVLEIECDEVTIYPPLSALIERDTSKKQKPIQVISERIGKLTSLHKLAIHCTDISSLPENMSHLQKLRVLDLSFNKKINLKNEIEKIKYLPALDTLCIFFTGTNDEELEEIKKKLPKNLVIIESMDDYMKYAIPGF